MIRILIAEDHQVVADALTTMLHLAEQLQVVGVARSGEDAVELTQQLRPDVVIMDISLIGMNGIEATRRITNGDGAVPVLVLTMHDDQDSITAAITAGAAGFLPKNVGRDDLIDALRSVAEGHAVIHPSITRPFLDRVISLNEQVRDDQGLTSRESAVLSLLADGHSTKQIAEQLIVAEETVKTHLKHLYQKLGARDRSHAISTAFRRGLVQ